jgi:thiosulfate reductase cytochrome b subunit
VLDVAWVFNGALYWVLLFVSGQWLRLVPMSWDVIPHALSVFIQYLSLDWPVHNGWIHYNALQLLLYGFTVFVAAPLAFVTGLRLSTIWPAALRWVPEKPTRTLHVLVMVYFIGFTIVHVGLILTTGALRNLNHIYAGRDDESWIGLIVFAGTLVLMIVGWVLARPAVLTRLAALSGTIRR